MISGGKFSHLAYDNITDLLFMYFEKVVVQDITGTIEPLVHYEDMALWLSKDQYNELREYFIHNPTPGTL